MQTVVRYGDIRLKPKDTSASARLRLGLEKTLPRLVRIAIEGGDERSRGDGRPDLGKVERRRGRNAKARLDELTDLITGVSGGLSPRFRNDRQRLPDQTGAQQRINPVARPRHILKDSNGEWGRLRDRHTGNVADVDVRNSTFAIGHSRFDVRHIVRGLTPTLRP